jgi:hypothetical protein
MFSNGKAAESASEQANYNFALNAQGQAKIDAADLEANTLAGVTSHDSNRA